MRMPRELLPDSTLPMLLAPYRFVARRARAHGSDAFAARLLLQRTICLTGEQAARAFYDEQRVLRAGAAPRRVQRTLFGRGGVQGLDGPVHRHRKAMFLSLMDEASLQRLERIAHEEWTAASATWVGTHEVALADGTRTLLTRVACRWAGVPLPEAEVRLRTRQLTLLFDGAGAVGPRHWLSRLARSTADAWAADLVRAVHAGNRVPEPGTALAVIAGHRELDGTRLAPEVAAVELLNVLRPIVAVSVFVQHLALALATHPAWRERLQGAGAATELRFVEEVRRHAPFFPAVVGRVRDDFIWAGMRFPRGRRLLLDLYGTNHDPRLWPAPLEFDPDRNRPDERGPFAFVPQGGGDPATGHRCPGEPATVVLMRVALEFLARRLHYEVAQPSLAVRMRRLPAQPGDGFVMRGVRPALAVVAEPSA
jgi:fatty-acid peroxygenase